VLIDIRAGSLLKAHGGFLMLHVRDLLTDALVWEKLSRFLRSGRLQIEESGLHLSPIAAIALEPEAVQIDVKIVLIGTVEEYYVLQEGAPEFFRRFMCKVEFAESFSASADTHQASAIFVAHCCQRLGLPHFNADAVARLIECTHREVDDQTRQSALFSHTESLIIESASHARQRSADKVQATDVDAAIAARDFRNGYIEQRLQESITDGERLISLQGEKIGQLNGLTVIELGDHAFGFPVRVTARTYAGNEGLVNIEREVKSCQARFTTKVCSSCTAICPHCSRTLHLWHSTPRWCLNKSTAAWRVTPPLAPSCTPYSRHSQGYRSNKTSRSQVRSIKTGRSCRWVA
jgi:predicted ATP-dependent protease